jgi:hypothetical protein
MSGHSRKARTAFLRLVIDFDQPRSAGYPSFSVVSKRAGYRAKDDRFPPSTTTVSTEAIVPASTKPGAPYLDFEMWASSEGRPLSSLHRKHFNRSDHSSLPGAHPSSLIEGWDRNS